MAIELSRMAVDQLFDDMGVTPVVTGMGKLLCFKAPGLRVFVGDIFDLTPDILGPVDLTFDRAALFALPPATRMRYADQLFALTAGAPQLLIALVYDQSRMRGPPFSVDDPEVQTLYGTRYDARVLARVEDAGAEGGLAFQDVVWLLR